MFWNCFANPSSCARALLMPFDVSSRIISVPLVSCAINSARATAVLLLISPAFSMIRHPPATLRSNCCGSLLLSAAASILPTLPLGFPPSSWRTLIKLVASTVFPQPCSPWIIRLPVPSEPLLASLADRLFIALHSWSSIPFTGTKYEKIAFCSSDNSSITGTSISSSDKSRSSGIAISGILDCFITGIRLVSAIAILSCLDTATFSSSGSSISGKVISGTSISDTSTLAVSISNISSALSVSISIESAL